MCGVLMVSHLCLASALQHGASLDDAVKLEAAVLVDGRHDACTGRLGLDAGEAWLRGRAQLHKRGRHGDRFGGRLLCAFRHGCGQSTSSGRVCVRGDCEGQSQQGQLWGRRVWCVVEIIIPLL